MIAAIVVAVLIAVGIVSCNFFGRTNGTLTYITHELHFNHADPGRNYTGKDLAWFGSYMQRTLVAYDREPKEAGLIIVPDLATDIGRSNEEHTSWSFTLRKGSTFEDGSLITCEDVKYGVSRVFATSIITGGPTYAIRLLDIPVDENGNSVYKGPYETANNDVAAFDRAVTCSPNHRTITFNLNQTVIDFNYTVTFLAFGPVPKKDDTQEEYDWHPVSSGPYKIQSYDHSKSMVLVRNDKWNPKADPLRKNRAFPDKIIVKFNVDDNVRDKQMIADSNPNAFNLDPLLSTNLTAIFDENGYPFEAFQNRVMNVYDPYVSYAAVNLEKLNCLPLRQAIFYAKDFKSLIDLSGGDKLMGDPADGVIKPNMKFDYQVITGTPDWNPAGNPDKAKILMNKAKVQCPALYQRATDPNRGITYDIMNGNNAPKVASIWKQAMSRAGITMKFNFIDPGPYYSIVSDPTKQGDLSGAAWAPDWPNASTIIPELFTKDGGFDLSRVENEPEYPAFLKRVNAALNQHDRVAQGQEWAALNQFIADKVWVIPGIFTRTQLVWGSNLGGVFFWEPQGTASFGDIYVK